MNKPEFVLSPEAFAQHQYGPKVFTLCKRHPPADPSDTAIGAQMPAVAYFQNSDDAKLFVAAKKGVIVNPEWKDR